jgi:hypothetical protein
MMRSPWTSAVVLVAGVIAIGTVGLAQSTTPQPPRDELAVEIRALRKELNERLEANIRAQLMVARLQLQEQRTTTVIRQLQEVNDKLRDNQQTKTQLEEALKMFAGMAGAEAAKDGDGFVIAPLRAQMKGVTDLETELKLQQTQLTAIIAEEQGRWNTFNAKLDELERAFTKK